jgi:hypothetical protein
LTQAPLTFDAADSALGAAFGRLCDERHWPGFRAWLYAKAILKPTRQHLKWSIASWFEDMIEPAPDEVILDDIQRVALDEWVPAAQQSAKIGSGWSLKDALSFRGAQTRVATRVQEVAGFLDGLLNREDDLPAIPAVREAVTYLEEAEEILTAIEGIATERTASLLMPTLEVSITFAINDIAEGLNP